MSSPRRKERRKPWTKKWDDAYLQSTWRFYRVLVTLLFLPAPVMMVVGLVWHYAKLPGYPPLIVWAICLGSLGFSLTAAFAFWRCPSCNALLFRTSSSSATLFFWLADPDDCPECGAPLKPVRKFPPAWKN